MTEEERYKITSNDYTDLIVEWNQNPKNFTRYPNATTHIIDNRFAIVYIPAEQLNSRAISQFGYAPIPNCFAINSTRSLEASGISRLRRLPNFNLQGQGVLIGIIDTGIDYTNPAFIKKDGTTKIAVIWDQTIEGSNRPKSAAFGNQYPADDINRALKSSNPFDIVPSKDDNGHGTMLAGIAAGSDIPEKDFSGVAPDSELVVVKLKQAKQVLRDFFLIPPNVPCFQENDIMWASSYIVDMARSLHRPVAVCIGLGSSQEGHDGLGPVSSLLTTLGDFPGIVVITAAGNEGNTRRHFYSEIDPNVGNSTIELNIAEEEQGFSMEIWGQAPNTYSIDILSPTGEYIPRIPEALRVSREISFVFEKTVIDVDYQMVEATTGDQLILLRFHNPTAGIWTLKVYGKGDFQGNVHSWLPSDAFITDNTYFVQSDPYTTITSPGNAIVPITVTAYNPDNNNLYQRSSRGYSRIGTIKPEIAAPGVNITAPTINQGFTQMTGTSAAAAHTTGAAALILEWGIVRGNYKGLDSVGVKKFMIRGAETNPNLVYPNRDWGFGILDVFNVFDVLRSSGQTV